MSRRSSGLHARLGPPPGPGQQPLALRRGERHPGAPVGQPAQRVGTGLQQRFRHGFVVRRHRPAQDREAVVDGVGVGPGLQQGPDLVGVSASYGRDQFFHRCAPWLSRTTGGA
ncbi:hypothetical protein ABT373_30015 [Streptomyces sp. NPDC000070]|uniref:hypothetical protein n=1 Tax=Streptomyces sp. NPDC000070 TaxID=3154240 RepID=UPI003321C7A2